MIFEVKEILDKYTKSEDVHNKAVRNSHPESINYCYLKRDRNGRWITGYTDGYYDEQYKKELLEEREALEQTSNIKFDENDEHDPYLSLLKIERALPNNIMPIYDTNDPHWLFKYRAALANGYIAPRKEDVGVGKYHNTTFYFESHVIETNKATDMVNMKIKAYSILHKNEKERAWLVIQCFLNGMLVKSTFKNPTLYAYLGQIVEGCKNVKELEQVIKTFDRKNQDIEAVFVAKKATDMDIVKFDNITREFTYTDLKTNMPTSLGSSVVDVEKYLSNTKKGSIYAEIRQQVYAAFEII